MEALTVKLLQRLSSSLTSADGVLISGYRNELRELRRKAGLRLDVLKELGRYADGASADANVSPISRKRSKARARHTQLDPHPFDCMGIAVPTTEDGARATRGDILAQLQNTLKVCVSPSGLFQDTNSVSGLPARLETTSGIRCIQTPT